MSALGQKQTFKRLRLMSALLPKADIAERDRDVRFVPKADMAAPRAHWRDVAYLALICGRKHYAVSGFDKAASIWSSAQSISSRVITSGGLIRMVWS
jgi:hypothetical protein